MINKEKELNKLKIEIKNCQKCLLNETSTHHLCGEGNHNSRILIIAQAPGDTEDAKGQMFIGPSGKIFRSLISNANLTWDDFYVTNLLKCRLPHNRRPKQVEIDTCIQFLHKEIRICNPDILVPLGFYSTQYIFRYLKYKDLFRDEYTSVIGKLFLAGQKKIYPICHPVNLIYKPELKENIQKQYNKLIVFKSKCKWYSVCPMTFFTKKNKIDNYWTKYYCQGDWSSCVRYNLEEQGIFHPDSMLPNGEIDNSLK